MLKKQEIYDRKKEASGQVSTQTRNLVLGFLAISWALLTAHDDPLKSMAAQVNRNLILALAAVSVLVLTFDLLQYVAVTRMAEKAFRKVERAGLDEGEYDRRSWAFKAQAFFYHAKFTIMLVGGVLLIVIFVLLFTAPKLLPTK
jgi:hypothetical protein